MHGGQRSGIRQGCPFSPYLFATVMTVMFHDIHADDYTKKIMQRITGTDFDELLYADDTICIAQIAADGATIGRYRNTRREILYENK